MTGPATPAADGCAALSELLGEPLAGSAARASTWLAIEQPGPYGKDALTESHLDPVVGAELARRTAGTGVRPQLIRRPGRHADPHVPGMPRQVLIAHTRPGATWQERVTVADPAELLDLDFAALGAGEAPGIGPRDESPVLLVCTNGRRDVCCALFGRPIVEALATRCPGAVWETTHTGGHRFAPTGVLLPTGYLYGRLDEAGAEDLLHRAGKGQLRLGGCRGRSSWSPAGQVAELTVRERIREERADAVTVIADEEVAPGRRTVRVRIDDGTTWVVDALERELTPERRTSCAKAPVVPEAWTVERLERV